MQSTVLDSMREGSVYHVELDSKLHPFQHTLQMELAEFVFLVAMLLKERELSVTVCKDGCTLIIWIFTIVILY